MTFLGVDVAFVDRGADINAKDNDNDTALFWAATSATTDALKYLLEKGADAQRGAGG